MDIHSCVFATPSCYVIMFPVVGHLEELDIEDFRSWTLKVDRDPVVKLWRSSWSLWQWGDILNYTKDHDTINHHTHNTNYTSHTDSTNYTKSTNYTNHTKTKNKYIVCALPPGTVTTRNFLLRFVVGDPYTPSLPLLLSYWEGENGNTVYTCIYYQLNELH